MENWLKSLSIRELKTWIKNCGTDLYPLIDRPNQENIKLAKEILKDKIDLAIMLDQEDRKENIIND
jgi:hypothetical protein